MACFRKRASFSLIHSTTFLANPQKKIHRAALALFRKLHLALDREFGLCNPARCAGLPASH